MESKQETERVCAFIDGFNLYFGLVEAGLDNCKWLNVKLLIQNLLKPHQQLVGTKYFTSRVSGNPEKERRQSHYLEALESEGIEIIYGHYQNNRIKCKSCGHSWSDQKEKKTDVNIATQLIIGAYKDKYDSAILVSGDSDLVPPIELIHTEFAKKRVMVFFPPKRMNQSLANVAKGSMILGRRNIEKSQLPISILNRYGFQIQKPKEWS